MSTFLEICQQTARDVGMAGNGPTTTIGQTGLYGDIVRWVIDSYTEIQNRNGGHWRFLRHEFTLPTVDTVDSYDWTQAIDSTTANPLTRFSEWRVNDSRLPPRIYLTASGVGTQTWMSVAPWSDFQQIYKISNQVDSYPAHVTVDPQDNIVIGPAPNGVYTITGEYFRGPQVLALDADVPEMPLQFHNLIRFYAIENYGYRQSAPEILNRAEKQQRKYMRQLERNQLERFSLARPLA